jgi:hypothetical protein
MKRLKPFADDRASQAIGGLTVENGTTKVSLYGSLDLTRDRAGLERARALKTLVDAAVAALEADQALPDAAPPPRPTRKVKNPFA